MPSAYKRPDPDQLLAQIASEAVSTRGKLRVYFGSSAGVGKTYAMLLAGRKRQTEGRRVLAGVVETHGRAETAALLAGVDQLPRKRLGHAAKALEEFDLDAALTRKPDLILVDEFAHSNAPGSRHPKRWQDVDELLAAGIDVYTTLNVQHLESLNDVVSGITGIKVRETVPDRIFDAADEIVMVDTTADELLARLAAGKVYLPEQAKRAADNFFRKGNLMALREIALRRTADRVEDDVEAYREAESIERVWKTDAALLVCVGPHASDKVVRSGARLAAEFGGRWHALYVETPSLQRLDRAARERVLRAMKLAESMGATTSVLTGDSMPAAIADYAAQHNFSRVALGSRALSRLGWRRWLPFSRDLFSALRAESRRRALDIDLFELANTGDTTEAAARSATHSQPPIMRIDDASASSWHGYAIAAAGCIATSVAATPLIGLLELSNIVMLFLLVVVLVAVRHGRGPAAFAAVLSVVMFDFFFVTPRFSFAVSDVEYLVTFAVMLAVGLITGQLMASLRYQLRVAASREARTRALYEFSREMSSALQVEQVATSTTTMLEPVLRAQVALMLPDRSDQLSQATRASFPELDPAVADWAYRHNEMAGYATDTLPANPFRYLPLKAPMRVRGVLAVRPDLPSMLLVPEQLRQLETYAVLIAIALERIHYVEVAQEALVQIESEQLRNNLLAALSHDLRTPVTAMVGLAESINLESNPSKHGEIGTLLAEEARRMATLVENILDMARIQSGAVHLKREWVPLEEIIGAALLSLRLPQAHTQDSRLPVRVTIDADVPLVHVDAVLIERAVANLVQNSLKYGGPAVEIEIHARVDGNMIQVVVDDNGPGLPPGRESSMFDKFVRGAAESSTTGVGLGLAIVRAIIESHGGRIHAAQRPGGGARFVFHLQKHTPPAMPNE